MNERVLLEDLRTKEKQRLNKALEMRWYLDSLTKKKGLPKAAIEILNNLEDPIIYCNTDHTVEWANPAGLSFLTCQFPDKKPEELIGTKCWDALVCKTKLVEEECLAEKAIKEKRTIVTKEVHCENTCLDGTTIAYVPLLNGIVGFFILIRKQS